MSLKSGMGAVQPIPDESGYDTIKRPSLLSAVKRAYLRPPQKNLLDSMARGAPLHAQNGIILSDLISPGNFVLSGATPTKYSSNSTDVFLSPYDPNVPVWRILHSNSGKTSTRSALAASPYAHPRNVE